MFTYWKIEALSPRDNISVSYQFPPPATFYAQVLFRLTCQEFRAKNAIFHGGITAGKFPNKCPEFSRCPERGQRYLFFFFPFCQYRSATHCECWLRPPRYHPPLWGCRREPEVRISLKRRWVDWWHDSLQRAMPVKLPTSGLTCKPPPPNIPNQLSC